ncbi:aminoglycoside phosphotransferase family protein [Catenulispora subtropica]|uniref:Aminoglycoside phosphotransferase family protein n=1 Tax=Catenulispora subtropica TaxID=450798 RepID=A0ABN2T832_9ACTN
MRIDHLLQTKLESACGLRGINPAGARLLHNYSNTIFHLPADDVLVRITVGPADIERVRLTQAVTGWLARTHDFPATAPYRAVEPVRLADGAVASFWEYHQQPQQLEYTSADLAALLRRLHQIDDNGQPSGIGSWQPLTSLETALAENIPDTVLPADDLIWLKQEITAVREELADVRWELPYGLIHGDAWAGNLLARDRSTALLLGDWDWVSIGPREVDLVPTWHAARRYGRDTAWTQAFAETYDYELSDSPGFETLMRMRDFMQLTGPLRHSATQPRYRDALRQRLDGIRSGDRAGHWRTM